MRTEKGSRLFLAVFGSPVLRRFLAAAFLVAAMGVAREARANPIDNWLGGTGNWSVSSNWDNGVPTASSDVVINSGGTDLVTLDVSVTVDSLQIGGPADGFFSELTDGGSTETLTITNALTVGQNGILSLTGSGSSFSAGSVSNQGSITAPAVPEPGALPLLVYCL